MYVMLPDVAHDSTDTESTVNPTHRKRKYHHVASSQLRRPIAKDVYIHPSPSAQVGHFERASLERCRGNSKEWENPVREKHYSLFC
jgi:hypothetical protein